MLNKCNKSICLLKNFPEKGPGVLLSSPNHVINDFTVFLANVEGDITANRSHCQITAMQDVTTS